MGFFLYLLYSWNLEKFKKGNKDSTFYKAKIRSTKISLCSVLLVLAVSTINSLWEAIELLMKIK